jgi:hypothetical protein
MADPFSSFSDDELSGGGGGDEISEDGMYRLKVLSAFDSYKTNPEDKDDPEQSRRVNLRVQVLDAVQDNRDDLAEPEEDVERRRKQRGNVRDITLWFDKEGNASLIEGNMKILASIAGSPQDDRPDEDLMREYHKGQENGSPVFELGQIADQMHINCSSLVGRDFIAVVQDTGDEYASFFPWYAERVPDDDQTPFKHPETEEEEVQTRSALYSGTDKASARMKEIFEGSNDEGGKEPAYAGEAEGGDGDLDDELPF